MEKESQNTEEKIIEAATEVFQEKGFEGARMREISDHANINKGLLHYYFKTKEALFNAIFSRAMSFMIKNLSGMLASEASVFDKIDLFVEKYMSFLLANPRLPLFIVAELNRNPERLINSIRKNVNMQPNIGLFRQSIEKAVANKEITPIDYRHLLINLISLSVFPFIARPMVQSILGFDNHEYKQMLIERKDLIKTFIKNAIVYKE